MIAIRCTQKLLKRASVPATDTPLAPTSLLGNWYANILFSRPPLVLCISERTLLPVVVLAKDMPTLPGRLAVATYELLIALGIPGEAADRERSEMQETVLARTDSKRVLGSLNDFMFHLEYSAQSSPEESLLERALYLGRIPCAPIKYSSPIEATQELFKVGGNRDFPIH